MDKDRLYIGTSGFSYLHWENGVFYPKNLPKVKQLEYYSKFFNTVEMNYPFYRLPYSKSFSRWKKTVPKGFVFAVKVSRYITHIKKLYQSKTVWKTFLERSLHLKEKLGPFLFQFPSNFKATEENVKKLEDFLKIIKKNKLSYAFEFRHKTWSSKKIYSLLKKYKVSWVIADSPNYPKAELVTSDFVYIPLHGSKVIFSSNYTKKELNELAKKIKKWLKQDLDVYVYFNNDALGFAVKDAKILNRLLR